MMLVVASRLMTGCKKSFCVMAIVAGLKRSSRLNVPVNRKILN